MPGKSPKAKGNGFERELVTVFDCQIVSEANHSEHWAKKGRRVRAQRELVAAELLLAFKNVIPAFPVTVTLTRIAPRLLDDDNLSRAFKAVRDSAADYLLPSNAGNQHRRWADDDDDRITWRYEQRKGQPKQHAVEIRIESE